MRLIRLFLILMLSVSLPFANVAAAAMVHCAQTETAAQSVGSDHMAHSGAHAGHHSMQGQSAADFQQNDSSSQNKVECANCSYCQLFTSVIVPPLGNESWWLDASSTAKTPLTSLVPRIFLEEPFRPPALAFA